MYATKEGLDILEKWDAWYVDGTFKTVPRLFLQLYTVHGLHQGTNIPLVYALLPSKTQLCYERFLSALLDSRPDLNPSTVMLDLELGMINAIKSKFPDAECTGCFFHLSQNVYRHIQRKAEMLELYTTNAEFALACKMIPALAFVPTGDVFLFFFFFFSIRSLNSDEHIS